MFKWNGINFFNWELDLNVVYVLVRYRNRAQGLGFPPHVPNTLLIINVCAFFMPLLINNK